MRALMEADEATVDLERQIVAFDGREVPFEINPEIRERLLNGLDDIALTLEHVDDIDRFEQERAAAGSLDHVARLTPRCSSLLRPPDEPPPTRAHRADRPRPPPRARRSPGARDRRECDPAARERIDRARFWSNFGSAAAWPPRSSA